MGKKTKTLVTASNLWVKNRRLDLPNARHVFGAGDMIVSRKLLIALVSESSQTFNRKVAQEQTLKARANFHAADILKDKRKRFQFDGAHRECYVSVMYKRD
jgi:hypothetical protein